MPLPTFQESYVAQPPIFLDDENVMWGAEDCNAVDEPDIMVDLDKMHYIPSVMLHIWSHMNGCRSYNAASHLQPIWWLTCAWALWAGHAART